MRAHVIAHRGASILEIENSIAAIERARDLGADRIEVDVHLSRDGIAVVHHDPDLRRSAGRPERVEELTAAELERVEIRYGRAAGRGARIPTLRESLDAARPVPLLIEIKGPNPRMAELVDRVVEIAASDDRIEAISFDEDAIARLLERLPQERVGLIRSLEHGRASWRPMLDLPCGLAVLSRRLARARAVSELARAGKRVYAYPLDCPEHIRGAVECGVQGVITNAPDVARRVLGESPGGS